MKDNQKNILSKVFGILPTVDHPVNEVENSPPILLVDQTEGLEVAGPCLPYDLRLIALQMDLNVRFPVGELSSKMTSIGKSCKIF